MRFRLLIAPLLGALVSAGASAASYTVSEGSTLGFSATFQGETFEGTFGKFEATIRYDPADLAAASFDVNIDLASVVTGDADRDASLPDPEFFDTSKFPRARFVTTGFRQSGTDVIADGTLTLKGMSKPVSLKVRFTANGSDATLDVTTTLQRLDFDVGSGEYADTKTIANEVKVKGHLKLKAQ